MTVDEALRRFADPGGFPREAMRWSLDHWAEASPRFLSRLRAFAAGGHRDDEGMNEAFFIVHLCAEARETRAYKPLCDMIAGDPDLGEWLGDAATETLSGILINLFDGDLAPLQRAIETPDGDEFARFSALLALGYLVRAKGAMSDDDMRAYLLRLRREMKPREECFIWMGWALTAARLGFGDLQLEMALLNKDGLVDPKEYRVEDFVADSKKARQDLDGLAGFADEDVRPLDDAIGTLEGWSQNADEGEEGAEGFEPADWAPPDSPYVNPFRGIGRNDPCPCGSGKKYKKCCMPA